LADISAKIVSGKLRIRLDQTKNANVSGI